MLANFLLNLLAIFSVLPFVVFALVWFLHYYWKRDKRTATMRSMDITTFFLIGVNAGLLDLLLGFSFGSVWLIILVFLLAFGLIGNAQQRLKGRLDAVKALRIVWRVGFFVLSGLYILLLLIGIIKYALR